ncbi:MAG TPA: hypothetical protein VFO46_20015 [Candidatus Sulfotelmatobacter sp.]|nr:hypothetical protein [Candidatus Sulfotelmatobacter sp.]
MSESAKSESAKKDWRELCAAVASEKDLKQLELLLEELITALDDRQFQLHVAMQAAQKKPSSAIK